MSQVQGVPGTPRAQRAPPEPCAAASPDPERVAADAVRRTLAQPVVGSLGWSSFALLFVYAVVLGGSWIGIYAVPLRAISFVVVAIALTAWCLVAWRHPAVRPRTSIWPALVLPLAAMGLSTLVSRHPRLGLDYLAWAVLLVALYLLLVRILALDLGGRRVGALAAALGLTLGLVYIAWVVALWVEWWSLAGRLEAPPLRPTFIGLTWGNPGAVLTVEVLLLLVAAAGLGTGTPARRLTIGVLTLVTLAVVILSGSRAGWMAVAASILLLSLPWLGSSVGRETLAHWLSDRRIRVVALGVLLLGAVTISALAPGILARIEEGGDGGRPTYFAVALRMFTEAPLQGTGPGTWAARRIVHTHAGELDYYIPHAHNVYLQTLAELGLLGILAGLVMVGCAAWLALRAVRSRDATRRRWGWAVLAGGLYLGLHCLFDSYANMPAVLLLMAVPVAWLDGTSGRVVGLPGRLAPAAATLSRAASAALIIACTLAVLHLVRSESGAMTHARAVELANQGAWESAVAPAVSAVEQDPDLPPHRFTRGLAAVAVEDWPAAVEAFGAVVRVDDLPQAWLGLALSQLGAGQPHAEVAASLRRAYRLGVQQPAVAYSIGLIYDRMAMTVEADNAYIAAIGQLPSLAADPSWRRDPTTTQRHLAVVERALASYPASAWELLLMSGQPERALRLAENAPGRGAMARSVVAAWGGDARAMADVFAEADAHLFDASRLGWAARLAVRMGDHERAARYRRLIAIGMPDSLEGYEVRIGRRLGSRDAGVGSRATNYGTYMYRRDTPWDVLPPGLPGLVREGAPGAT